VLTCVYAGFDKGRFNLINCFGREIYTSCDLLDRICRNDFRILPHWDDHFELICVNRASSVYFRRGYARTNNLELLTIRIINIAFVQQY